MKICFYNNSKEKIKDKSYPIGNFLITFLNEFHFDKKLIEQKDSNLMMYIYETMYQLCIDDLLEIYSNTTVKNIEKNNDKTLILKVKLDDNNESYFKLTKSDFRELVKLIEHIYNFMDIKDKFRDRSKIFMYYFNTCFGYEVPKYKIKNPKKSYEYNQKLLDSHRNLIHRQDMQNFSYILQNNIIELIKKMQNVKKSDFITEYQCDNVADILLASLHYISNNNIYIRKCNLCDRLFIPTSNSQKFCKNSRPRLENESEEDYPNIIETCSQYNSRYQSNKNMSLINKAKRDVTQRIQQRMRRSNKTEKEKKKYLEEWKKKVEKQREFYPDDIKYCDWIYNCSDEQQIRRRKNGSSGNRKK